MEIKEEPFDDEPQNVIKIPKTPSSDTLQVEIKEENIEQSETELPSYVVEEEHFRSNEIKNKEPMSEEAFDEDSQNMLEIPSTPSPEGIWGCKGLQGEIKEENLEQSEIDLSPDIVEDDNSRSNETQYEKPMPEEPQNVTEVPSSPSPERLQVEIKEEYLEQSEIDLSPDIVEDDNSRSNETQYEESMPEEPQNVTEVPSSPSPERLQVEIKEEDLEHNETELSPHIVEEESSRNNERQDEEPMPVQTEKIVARLYYYLKKEYEVLEKNNPKCDLGPLTNILQRTADATKLSEADVLEILKEYPEVPSTPEETYSHVDEQLPENHNMSKRKRR